eukprot:11404554-Heterocapsa_arctica.AAC.1
MRPGFVTSKWPTRPTIINSKLRKTCLGPIRTWTREWKTTGIPNSKLTPKDWCSLFSFRKQSKDDRDPHSEGSVSGENHLQADTSRLSVR